MTIALDHPPPLYRHSPLVPSLLALCVLAGSGCTRCGREQAPPVEPIAVDPLIRWRPFFSERFGAVPQSSWQGDFNGDGSQDLAVLLQGSRDALSDARLLLFHEVGAEQPASWHAIPPMGSAVSVQSGTWAIGQLPELSGMIAEGQSVLVLGDGAAVAFWHAGYREYGWLPVISDALGAARRDAAQRVPEAFRFGQNNLLGEEGLRQAERAEALAQAFSGDFDGDGRRDLVVFHGGQLLSYLDGALPPKRQSFDYPAVRGLMWHNRLARVTPFPEDDSAKPPAPVEIRNDFLALSIPEQSSICLHLGSGAWELVWLSD